MSEETHPSLAEAIRMVLPHASRDQTLPVLNAVCITAQHVTASDRYTAARVRVDTPVPAGEELIIPLRLARLGIAAINDRTLTIETPRAITKLHLDAEVGWATITLPDDQHVQTYPAMARLFDEFTPAADGAAQNPIAITSTHLSKYSPRHFPLSSHAHQMRLERAAQPNKPTRITIPEYPAYESLLVPVRITY